MTEHLSDEQFTRYLNSSEDARAQSHLVKCQQCRAEATRLLGIVGSSRAHAERAGERNANFWARQRNEVRDLVARQRPVRPTWTLALAMALLVLASIFMFQSQTPRPTQGPTETRGAKLPPDDEALLSAINSTLEQDVPSALAPLQQLAYQREQAEENRNGQN